VYSPSGTGEKFPVRLVNYSSLAGESKTFTIIDAEETSMVLDMYYDTIPGIRNMTIAGGNYYSGGGINSYSSDISLFNLKIAGNKSDYNGGGICISGGKSILLNLILENNSSEDGGSLYASYSKLEMTNMDVSYNRADNGGGIYLENSDSVLMDEVNFSANSATGFGGGIYASGSDGLNITNAVLDSNTATKGGGIWSESTSLNVKNSLFTNNSTTLEYGGAGLIYNHLGYEKREVTFCNVTFANNSNPGIYFYSGEVNLINNIFWYNSGQYQVFYIVTVSRQDTLTVMNSNIQGGLDGIFVAGPGEINWLPGNINEDPQFLLSGDYPYSLGEGSPCIDAGTPDTTGLNLPFNDMIGNTRVWDGDGDGVPVIDMGPYEFGAPVNVPEDGDLNDPYPSDTYIYPNPASDHLTIGSLNNKNDRTVTFINSTGQVVLSAVIQAGQGKLVVSLDSFSPGLYTVLFSDENGVFALKKVVVIK
jgi:predicted outer membrane repeat protein